MSQGRGPFVNDTCDRETTLQKMGEKCELLSQSKGMESRRKKGEPGVGGLCDKKASVISRGCQEGAV